MLRFPVGPYQTFAKSVPPFPVRVSWRVYSRTRYRNVEDAFLLGLEISGSKSAAKTVRVDRRSERGTRGNRGKEEAEEGK